MLEIANIKNVYDLHFETKTIVEHSKLNKDDI